MKITLEMVDEVIARTNVSYSVAKSALERCEGDVLEAILEIENLQNLGSREGQHKQSHQMVDWIKKLIKEGLIRQIIIEKNDKVVLDVPIVAGALAGVLLTKSTVVAIIAAVATGCQIYLVKKDMTRVHLNKVTVDTFESLKNLFVCETNFCEDKPLQEEEPVVQSYQNND